MNNRYNKKSLVAVLVMSLFLNGCVGSYARNHGISFFYATKKPLNLELIHYYGLMHICVIRSEVMSEK